MAYICTFIIRYDITRATRYGTDAKKKDAHRLVMQADPVVQVAGALGVLRELLEPRTRNEAESIAVALASGERLAPALRERATTLDTAMCTVRGDTLPSIIPEHHPLHAALRVRVFNHIDGATVAQRGTINEETARRCVAACAAIPDVCLNFTVASYMLGSEQAAGGGAWVAALAAEIVALRREVARLGTCGPSPVHSENAKEKRAAPLPCWSARKVTKNPWD